MLGFHTIIMSSTTTTENFQQGIEELRTLLFKPEVMAEELKPYFDQVLAAQMDETRRQITETVAPVLGEALHRVERKNEEQNQATQKITQTMMDEAVNKVEQIAAEQSEATQKVGQLLQQLAQAEQARQQMAGQLDDTLTQVKAISDQQQTLADNLAALPAPVPPPPAIPPTEQRRELVQTVYPVINELVNDAVFRATEKMEQSLIKEQEAVRAAEERASFWLKLLTAVIVLLLLLLSGMFCAWAYSMQELNNLRLAQQATATAEAIALQTTATHVSLISTPQTATATPTQLGSQPELAELPSATTLTETMVTTASTKGSSETNQIPTSNETPSSTGDAMAENSTSTSTDETTAEAISTRQAINSDSEDEKNGNARPSAVPSATLTNEPIEQPSPNQDIAVTTLPTSSLTVTNQLSPTIPISQANYASLVIATTSLSQAIELPYITGTIIADITPFDLPNGQAMQTRLPQKTEVTVFSAEDEWYQLSFLLPETGVQQGWVPTEYVQLHGPLPTSLLPKTGDR